MIEELYGKLIDFVAAAKSFAATIEWSGGPDKKEKGTLLWQRASEFSTYFQRHRIYFSENTCQKIDDLFKKLTGPSQGFSCWLAQSEKHAGAAEKMHDAWETASRTITTEAPQLVAAVEHDFRSILGVAKER